MQLTAKGTKIISWIFLSTGIFAIVGAIYTWGEGPLYHQDDLLTALVPWADLLITGPISILAAFGMINKKEWGGIAGLMTCGIYLFGSALVYITLAWEGPPYPLHLALPPLSGIAIGIGYPIWILRRTSFSFQGNHALTPKHRTIRHRWSKSRFWTISKDLQAE